MNDIFNMKKYRKTNVDNKYVGLFGWQIYEKYIHMRKYQTFS